MRYNNSAKERFNHFSASPYKIIEEKPSSLALLIANKSTWASTHKGSPETKFSVHI